MVSELVKMIHGSITVDSRPGEGARFIVTLPLRDAALPVTGSSPVGQDRAGEADKPSVLVVEDNPELAAFVTGILSDRYTVSTAAGGNAALEIALRDMPDCIVSDVMMPGMDGYELCRRLRADIRISHIPVVLLTAKTAREDILEGLSAGATAYLTKPFHPGELLLRVHNLLDGQQKLRDRLRQELLFPPGEKVENEGVQDIFLTRAYEELDRRLDDTTFGVDQLAEVLHISRSSLHRKMKSITGLSTGEVIRNYRLRHAAGLLLQGFNSQEAAYQSGFGSPAYFSKSFKDVYGLTPTEYARKNLR
jgi:DNA-binding response OmpR family regulator